MLAVAATIVVVASPGVTMGTAGGKVAPGPPAVPPLPPAPPALLELSPCAGDDSRPRVPPPGPGQAAVSVHVPPTVLVRVADGGRVEASTNTGCAPRPTDRFATVGGTAVTATVVAGVVGCGRAGDWTVAGRWVEASC